MMWRIWLIAGLLVLCTQAQASTIQAGSQGTHLTAEGDIAISATRQHSQHHSHHSARGYNAGIAIAFDNGISLGITAGGNYGRGHGSSTSTTHRHSHIGSTASTTRIRSGGALGLHGAQVHGHTIQTQARDLHISSPQDSAHSHSRQQHLAGQITIGYGVSGSASYQASRTQAEHRAVAEQSGIYARAGGFDIDISGHTQLDGGFITSSAEAEAAGRNRLRTATIDKTDIHNHSQYKGRSHSLGASGGTDGTGEPAINSHSRWASQKQTTSLQSGSGADSGHASSSTTSGIGTANITITAPTQQQQRTGQSAEQAAAAIRTDKTTGQALQEQGLGNIYDAEKVQQELQLQTDTTREFGQTAPRFIAAAAEQLGQTRTYERAAAYQEQLQQQLAHTSDPQHKTALTRELEQIGQYLQEHRNTYSTWKEGGIGRAALHAAGAALMTGTGSSRSGSRTGSPHPQRSPKQTWPGRRSHHQHSRRSNIGLCDRRPKRSNSSSQHRLAQQTAAPRRAAMDTQQRPGICPPAKPRTRTHSRPDSPGRMAPGPTGCERHRPVLDVGTRQNHRPGRTAIPATGQGHIHQ